MTYSYNEILFSDIKNIAICDITNTARRSSHKDRFYLVITFVIGD